MGVGMGVAEKVEKGKGYCVGNMSRKGQKVTFSICCGETSHLM
jgi:putative component of toxin-antitoxin plasmid stabilization module